MEHICVGLYTKPLVHGTTSQSRVMQSSYRAERGGLAAQSKPKCILRPSGQKDALPPHCLTSLLNRLPSQLLAPNVSPLSCPVLSTSALGQHGDLGEVSSLSCVLSFPLEEMELSAGHEEHPRLLLRDFRAQAWGPAWGSRARTASPRVKTCFCSQSGEFPGAGRAGGSFLLEHRALVEPVCDHTATAEEFTAGSAPAAAH